MEEFMEWYRELYPEMYRIAYYYMRNRQEAEDAVMDAVLAAFEKKQQLKDKGKYRAWIMQILVNRCRKRMKKWFLREEDIDQISLTEKRSISKETDFAMSSAVKQAFWNLGEEERMIVSLSVFGGYKGEEIADLLGKNHSTIRSKYRRALHKMKMELEV